MIDRRIYRWTAAGLLAAAAWQLGQSGYIQAKAVLAQLLLHQAWVRTRAGVHHAHPWPWADTWPVARLQVPRSGVDLIVLAGATGRTLAFGPGHLDGTAAPGRDGVSVISGHRDTHFRFLRHLRPGTLVRVQSPDGRWHRFRTLAGRVMDARHATLALAAHEPVLSLVTCYPFDALRPGGEGRYVVNALPEAVPQVPSRASGPLPAAR